MSDQPRVEGRPIYSQVSTFVDQFSYPPDIRKAIYTTNAIESLNSVIRAAIKKRKVSLQMIRYERLFIWRSRMHRKIVVCLSRTGGYYRVRLPPERSPLTRVKLYEITDRFIISPFYRLQKNMYFSFYLRKSIALYSYFNIIVQC